MRRRILLACLLSGITTLFFPSDSIHAQDNRQAILDELAEEYRPGWIGRYRDQVGNTLTRIDSSLSFNWRQQTADARLETKQFEASWTGLLFLQSVGKYTLYVETDGEVELEFAGRKVSEKSGPEGLLTTGSVEMQFGWHPIKLTYKSPPNGGKLKLLWQGPAFKLEPIGNQFLFHPTEETIKDHFGRGEELAHALRCARCHESPVNQDSIDVAPSLTHFRDFIQPSWLVARLKQKSPPQGSPVGDQPIHRMPAFGLSEQQAKEVTAYLFQNSSNPKPAGELLAAGNVESGKIVFASVGCLACHQADSMGKPGLFDGGNLNQISLKRKDDFWIRWFKNPAEVNPHHRMPQVSLSDKEEQDVIAYLRSLKPAESVIALEQYVFDELLAERGRKVYHESGCANCHEKKVNEDKIKLSFDETYGCLDSIDAQRHRPAYTLSDSDRNSLVEFYTHVKSSNSDTTQALLVRQNNCFQCHARHESGGIRENLDQIGSRITSLDSLKPALAPPSLNGVGDKLHDEALKDAIARKDSARRPWLKVRMPQFGFSDDKLNELIGWFVEKDRVDDAFIALHHTEIQPEPTREALYQAGSRLVTTDGFGCTSCHQVGSMVPPKAPLNAKGPDLSLLNSRIRKVWFSRWVSNPARMVPRMEMPSVRLAVRGVLENHLPHQLDAVWETLNQEGFEPPAPGAVRIARLSGIKDVDRGAKVLTDVVFHHDVQYIKPALIGLRNRHNLMWDMEAGRFLGWWQGDIARQRTKGKIWFWETAGESWSGLKLEDGFQGVPDFQLINDDGEIHSPALVGQFTTSLDSWVQNEDYLQLTTRFKFEIEGQVHWVHVTQDLSELWEEDQRDAKAGIERVIHVKNIPDGYRPLIGIAPKSLEIRETDQGFVLSVPGQQGSRWVQTAARPIVINQEYYGLIAEQETLSIQFLSNLEVDRFPPLGATIPPPETAQLSVLPGVTTTRLPFFDEFMPTGIDWDPNGDLWLTSLKGRIWKAVDTDQDGMEDQLSVGIHELAAPYGLQANSESIDVINKYALLRMFDRDKDGHYEKVQTIAAGWGHTADYHDWTVGPVPDGQGGYFITTACQQDDRSKAAAHLRGSVLHLVPRKPTQENPYLFQVKTYTKGHRFPMGLARNASGQLYVSDNQGNYNPYNEINHVIKGKHFGFINKLERVENQRPPLTPPAIDMPHPWTRSVNGICFLETPLAVQNILGRNVFGPFEGHMVGCEYDTRRLIRMSFQKVGETMQGAAYPLTLDQPTDGEPLLGPLSVAVSPAGDLYVASIRDSGWGGANNIGTLAKMDFANAKLPAGIAEVKANATGFEIFFTAAVDGQRAADPKNYSVQSATRISTTSYGGTDRDRKTDRITSLTVAPDSLSVQLNIEEFRAGFIYDLKLRNLNADESIFFPAEAYYTLRTIPVE
tara:strand:- start:5171 stop:9409 length:4239 start_codon:yes stop_codon:yes gene_type:complete